jgi:polyferredoxin
MGPRSRARSNEAKAAIAAAVKRGPTLLQRVVSIRRMVQISVGVTLWVAISNGYTTLTVVVVAGSLSGIVLGKFFCRWMCPMGAIMETLMGMNDPDGRQRALYGYFKVGCPISWAQGLLNRISFWRVRVEPSLCTHCSRCDKACYVAQLAPGNSLHLGEKANASTHYSCSRCLQCVGACPTGALSLGLVPLRRGARRNG